MTTFASQASPFGTVVGSGFPKSSAFTLVGSGATHTYTEYGNSVVLSGAGVGSTSLVGYEITPPATPWTLTVAIRVLGSHVGTTFVSAPRLFFRESSSGKYHLFGPYSYNTPVTRLGSAKYTNSTTFSATYSDVQISDDICGGWVHYRIADNGTNRICSFSYDGYNFNTFHTVTRLDFLTGGANMCGILIELSGASGGTCAGQFANWRMT